MPSSHLILCRPLLLLPPIPPSIRVFSNESTLRMKWPKYWSFSFSISPSNEYSRLIFFKTDWFDLLAFQGTLSQESSPEPQFESINSSVLSLLCGPTLTSIHDYWKSCIALTIQNWGEPFITFCYHQRIMVTLHVRWAIMGPLANSSLRTRKKLAKDEGCCPRMLLAPPSHPS